MAPGNLNLKKSWHPGLLKNQKKVWEAEQEALSERKKIKERQDEIAKERELAELKALQFSTTGKKIHDRVEWMYDTSGVGNGGKLDNDNEDYLLGKKRVDDLVVSSKVEHRKHGFEKLEQEPQLSQDHGASLQRDDPLVRIRQQQLKKMKELKNMRSASSTSDSRRSDGGRHDRQRSRHGVSSGHGGRISLGADRRSNHEHGKSIEGRRRTDRGGPRSHHDLKNESLVENRGTSASRREHKDRDDR